MRDRTLGLALLALILLLVAGWVALRTDFFGRDGDRQARIAGGGRGPSPSPPAPPLPALKKKLGSGSSARITRHSDPEKASPPTPAGSRLAIAGHVTDTKGDPIAGAALEWGQIGAMPATEAEARTDPEGAYRIEVTAAGPTYQLSAFKPGFAPAWARNVVPGTAEEPAVVDFELGKGSRLRGLIVDEESVPVDGAEVRARTTEAGFDSSFSMVLGPLTLPGADYQTHTGRDGSFRFENLPEEMVHLDVEKEGFDGISGTHPTGEEVRITIRRRNGVVRGRVVDAESGAPVGEFQVHCCEQTWSFYDSEGRFEIGPFLPGTRLIVEIAAEEYALDSYNCMSRSPGEAAEAEIKLRRGTTFRAMLIDGRTGGPLANASLIAAILPPGQDIEWGALKGYHTRKGPLRNVWRLITNASGAFDFQEKDPKLTIFIFIPGLERRIVRPEERPPPGPDGGIRIELRPEASITGECAAVPPGGATARLWRTVSQGEVEATFEAMTTDSIGRYRWGSLQPGHYLVTIPGLTRRVAVLAERENRLNLGESLGPATISGRSPPWAEITLTPRFDWDYQELKAQADHAGNFEIAGLKKGRYEVRTFVQSIGAGGINLQRKSLEIEVVGDGELDLTGP